LKIIYIHQYFRTPTQGGSLRSYYLAKALVEKGYEVEMITTHHDKKYQKVDFEGITIHYLPVFYDNPLGFGRRVFAFLKFLYLSYQTAKTIQHADICYATSTPLTVGVVAWWLKKRKKMPYFFEVRDLWPQAPIELGFIRHTLLKRFLYFIEKKIYQNADKIIALSPASVSYIQKIVPDKKVFLIPNMADTDFFQLEEKRVEMTQKYGYEGKFVVTYFGTIGLANHLEYLLEIAQEAQNQQQNDIHFLIVGKGAKLGSLQKLAQQLGLQNLDFLPHTSKATVKEILNITDAVYVSFWNKPILQATSPNKFFDALASGKLCVVNTVGWLKDLVEQNECGFYAHPENPNQFLEKIKPFLKDIEKLKTYHKNARKLAETQFSRHELKKYFLELFEIIPSCPKI
jgi:glycosyltransferase involved in cell wall biosynthesis